MQSIPLGQVLSPGPNLVGVLVKELMIISFQSSFQRVFPGASEAVLPSGVPSTQFRDSRSVSLMLVHPWWSRTSCVPKSIRFLGACASLVEWRTSLCIQIDFLSACASLVVVDEFVCPGQFNLSVLVHP